VLGPIENRLITISATLIINKAPPNFPVKPNGNLTSIRVFVLKHSAASDSSVSAHMRARTVLSKCQLDGIVLLVYSDNGCGEIFPLCILIVLLLAFRFGLVVREIRGQAEGDTGLFLQGRQYL